MWVWFDLRHKIKSRFNLKLTSWKWKRIRSWLRPNQPMQPNANSYAKKVTAGLKRIDEREWWVIAVPKSAAKSLPLIPTSFSRLRTRYLHRAANSSVGLWLSRVHAAGLLDAKLLCCGRWSRRPGAEVTTEDSVVYPEISVTATFPLHELHCSMLVNLLT